MDRRELRQTLNDQRAKLGQTMRNRRALLREQLAVQRAEARARLASQRAPARRSRTRRLLLLLLLLVVYLLLQRCDCTEPPPPPPAPAPGPAVGVQPPVVTRLAPTRSSPAPTRPGPAPGGRIEPRQRPSYAGQAPAIQPWLPAFRLQVAARGARLGHCLEGAERPGALRWTTSVDTATGTVSDHQLEPLRADTTLSRELRSCLIEALAATPYRLEWTKEQVSPARVSVVVEF